MDVLSELDSTLEERKAHEPERSYTASLFAKGLDTILKKVGEEATEVVIAAKSDDKDHLVYEVADLWFHTLVLLAHEGRTSEDVLKELERRLGQSGLDEKAKRKARIGE